jgi:hypothetical protein
MKERPILFKGPMVRSIIDGLKTQTRRTINPQPSDDDTKNSNISYDADGDCFWWRMPGPIVTTGAKNKYGDVGDRLWVKETFSLEPKSHAGDNVIYRADGKPSSGSWKPSIFMPRWSSRITLEIVSTRVERLNDISESDAKAEGVESVYPNLTPVLAYEELWESINGKNSWSLNPFCWVITFKRL